MKYASHLLAKVQWVFLRQLEMGESELKGVTMGVLFPLNKLWVPETLEMWGEESM